MLLPGTSRMRQNKTLIKHLQSQIPISAESSFSSFLNFLKLHSTIWGFPDGSDGKEHTCKAGDLGSIPGSGRPCGEGMATHFRIFAWRFPWIEEPGGLQFIGSQSRTLNRIKLYDIMNTRWRYNPSNTHKFILILQHFDSSIQFLSILKNLF